MRPAIVAAALGGVLLTAAACGTDAKPGPTTAAPATSGPTSAPAAPEPDYTADTKAVCAKLTKVFGPDMQSFGAQVGKMIAYKEAKQAPEAAAAQKAAAEQLRTVADKIRKETAAAQDPELQTAGATSAEKLTKSAGDKAFFDQIKSSAALAQTISGQMAEWLSPVAGYCS